MKVENIENTALREWIQECADLCKPDKIVICDGSEEEKGKLTKEALSTGELISLDQEKLPGCVYHRTAVNDVARTGWVETLASYGDPKDVAVEMLKGAKGHDLDVKLSDAELAILRGEKQELDRVAQTIAAATQANLNRLWQIRAKEAEITKLKSSLWDYEMDEKERVRGMLITECEEQKK